MSARRRNKLRPRSIVPSSLDNPWFAGAGFDAASVVRGVVGVETDTIPNNMSAQNSCGNQLTVFFHRQLRGDTLGNAEATAYTAPSGAVVFAAGSKNGSPGDSPTDPPSPAWEADSSTRASRSSSRTALRVPGYSV